MEGFVYGMKVHLGVDYDSGLIHSVVTTAASMYDLTPAAELLHGDEEVVSADAGYQGIATRLAMAGKTTALRVAMWPGTRRDLPDTPEGRVIDLIVMAKAHIRAKGEHPFRVIYTTTAGGHSSCSGFRRPGCEALLRAVARSMWLPC